MENMALFRNADLVPDAPETWDELLAAGGALQESGDVTYALVLENNGYKTYPILTNFGGYVFGRDADGNWDPNDVGIDSEGMIAAGNWIAENVAAGLTVRHDHGSQYLSDAFQAELAFLGIQSSPAFVRAPEGNGCAERVIRTLKEQLLWVRTFATVEDLRVALIAWAELYNREWLIERHGFKPPAEARRAYYQHRERLAA